MHALGIYFTDVHQGSLTLEAALGANPSDDYAPIKAALSRQEEVRVTALSLRGTAGVPNLGFDVHAQPLRDSDGHVHCYLLQVTPQPDVNHVALLDALCEESGASAGLTSAGIASGLTDPTALPLVAAASAGSPLPRNFLVRKVLEEAANANHSRAGGAQEGSGAYAEGGSLAHALGDPEMPLALGLDPFGDCDVLMEVTRLTPTPTDLSPGAHGHGDHRRRACSVPRRVTTDSIDGGSSNDGSNPSESNSSNTQVASHDSSNSSSAAS